MLLFILLKCIAVFDYWIMDYGLWIIGLLDYWIVGLLDYWIIGLLDYWIIGLLDY